MVKTEINDTNFQKEVIEASAEQPVLVKMTAPWCAPCKQQEPDLIDLFTNEMSGVLKYTSMNIDESPITPTQLNIRGVPTLLVFKSGEVVAQQVGAQSKEKIKQWLEDTLA